MFPTLSDADIDRLRRFGEVRPYRAGSVRGTGGRCRARSANHSAAARCWSRRTKSTCAISRSSRMAPAASWANWRSCRVGRRWSMQRRSPMSKRSSSPSRRLRDLMVEEADLGERIMRALILRRVGLLERGVGGPIIVGYAAHRDVLRLEGFLTRNGHPHQRLDPGYRRLCKDAARTFSGDARRPADRAVRAGPVAAQSDRRPARALHRHGSRRRFDDGRTTSRSSAPVRPVSPPRCMPRPKDCR